MCTLIAGVEVLGPRTLIVGANRDESPERASAPPGILRDRPRVAGGKDLVAGGTWLAVREARAVTALMNRRPSAPAAAPTPLRSRGLLCLDAAAAGPSHDAPHAIDPGTGDRHATRLHAALALIGRDAYAACTLVGLDVEEPSWAVLAETGVPPVVRMLEPGWHVLTHADVDDRSEPRTRWLLDRLERWDRGGGGADEALERVADLLRVHADSEGGTPGVCLHRERFPTVSSTLLALGDVGQGGTSGRVTYRHAAGPPCVTPYEDVSSLLA